MTAAEWLDQAQARCDAATEGPWALDLKWDERHGTNYGVDAIEAHDTWPVVDGGIEEDAEFIAAARTDLPRAIAALRAAMEVHEPTRPVRWVDRQVCVECSDHEVGLTVFWPCATVRAIEEALA